jgi:hypothetical protein
LLSIGVQRASVRSSHLSCHRADVDYQAAASRSHVRDNSLDQSEDVENAEGEVTFHYIWWYIQKCT